MREWPVPMVVEGRVYRTITVLRGPYRISVGEPFTPPISDDGGPEEDERITGELKERMHRLIEEVRINESWAD